MDTSTELANALDRDIAALKAKAADYDARHHVIEDDAESAWQQFKTPRGPRFDDVQHAKDEEPDDRAPDVYGMERQRYEHAHDLVDDDRAGIDASEMMLGFRRTPQANEDHDSNRAQFDRGRLLTSNQIVEAQREKGAERSWRDGRVTNVRARGDEYTQTTEGHGLKRPIKRTAGEPPACGRSGRAVRDVRRTGRE